MNDNIWLVVWDLDGAFPIGGGAAAADQYVGAVKALVGRGIMNACCSRGPLGDARERLEALGIWDYFVFPSVSPHAVSKAERVEQAIKNTRLRPQYALYLDNGAFNRKLAEAALPKLNTAKPADIFSLMRQPAMKGFSDKLHVRLAQYKLAKTVTEGASASCFEVMAHAVMECAIAPSEPCLPDIQKLMEGPPTLNYTGSALTPGEIGALLKDPDVRHGCVTLKDIREDHGVVGFFAARGNALEHFVFSPELLDLPGAEQWAYAELGYPKLNKSKSCIGEVDNSPAPNWVNQSALGAVPKSPAEIKLLIRGGAEMDGIARRLQGHVSITQEGFGQAESLCYAVKGNQYTETEIQALLQAAPQVAPNVLSTAMFSGEYDYVLVSVISERSMVKFSMKSDQRLTVYFPKERLGGLGDEFFEDFQSYVYSDDELYDALQYICDNLPRHTSLIVMTAPEVEFTRVAPSDGGDPDRFPADHQRRLRYNAIAEEIVVGNTNAYLLDIRSFVKTESDLRDFHVMHYNPQADYELSRILTALLGIKLPERLDDQNAAPALEKAKLSPEAGFEIFYRAFIVNGLFVTQVEKPAEMDAQFSFKVMMGSMVVDETGFGGDAMRESLISAFGVYWARVGIKHLGAEYYFETPYFVYNEKTVFNYIDRAAPNFSNIHRGHLLPMYDAADSAKRQSVDLGAEIMALLASGCGVFDYFERIGVKEVSILADAKTAALVMDGAGNAKVRVKKMFTLDMPFSVGGSLGVRHYRFEPYSMEAAKEAVGDGGALLVACVPGKNELADITKLIPGKAKAVWLHNLLHELATERFFTAGIREAVSHGGPVIALRLPTIRGIRGASADDRKLLNYNTAKLLTDAERDISSLPGVFEGVSYDKLSQTALLPPIEMDEASVWRFSDRGGQYINITNGFRRTDGQPKKYAGTIYIFGGSMVFGKLASDGETIASKLQASLNLPLRVVNCANFDGRMQASRMMSLINSIQFAPNDVVVIAMEEDQTATTIIPFQFKYIDDSFVKADATSVLSGEKGAYYLNNVFSPRGNELVAELIRDKVYGLVRLFG